MIYASYGLYRPMECDMNIWPIRYLQRQARWRRTMALFDTDAQKGLVDPAFRYEYGRRLWRALKHTPQRRHS
jgi:hypothetical protein